MQIPIEPQLVLIRKWPLYLLAAIFFATVILLFKDTDQPTTMNYCLSGVLIFFIFASWLLGKTSIIIDDDGITITRLFKRATLKWADIRTASLRWQPEGMHSVNVYWTMTTNDGSHQMEFQPSFYSRHDLRLIASVLVEKSPEATIDERITRMSLGKFPWYLF